MEGQLLLQLRGSLAGGGGTPVQQLKGMNTIDRKRAPFYGELNETKKINIKVLMIIIN
jgi:hypothetical protein